MALENTDIQNKLIEAFGEGVKNFQQEQDIFAFEIDPAQNTAVMLFLKNNPDLRFEFLTDVCGVHYPDNPESEQFSVVYHLHNWYENKRIRMRAFLSGAQPQIKTVSNIFLSANWMERETYDFFGIEFTGHPQLKRILNMDEMESFPLRKEFPLEDSGRTDKDDRFFGRTTSNC